LIRELQKWGADQAFCPPLQYGCDVAGNRARDGVSNQEKKNRAWFLAVFYEEIRAGYCDRGLFLS
jgi:hypothetical protein